MPLLLALLLAQAALPAANAADLPVTETTGIGQSRLANCLDQAEADPEDGIATASAWLADARGGERAGPQMCLGTAYARLERWDDAQTAFTTGRDEAAPGDHLLRARLGIMAANAALADGSPVGALAVLDAAKPDVAATGTPALAAALAEDRARAMVALKRPEDAAAALAEARAAAPGDAEAWLLSATLSRRLNKLAEAQGEIETAGRLAPNNAEVGLEAGVIAALAGHIEAARKDWQAIAIGDGPAHQAARAYLEQTGDTKAPDSGPH